MIKHLLSFKNPTIHLPLNFALAKSVGRSSCSSMIPETDNPIETGKRLAAFAAVDENVKADMVIGIGSGSTIAYSVERLADKVKAGLTGIVCVPSSFQAKQLIVDHGLVMSDLDRNPKLDIAIDGADEVDAHFNLIKGGGGALLQEKVVVSLAEKFFVVADYRKDSNNFGDNWKKGIPIEVLPMAWKPVAQKIEKHFGGEAPLRMAVNKAGPVVTDNGNFIIDWKFALDARFPSWAQIDKDLHMIPGLIETGLFCDMATKVYFGMKDGSIKITGPHI